LTETRTTFPWTIIAAAIAAGMAFIDTTALTVALPALRENLHASDSDLLWIHNAYAVTLASLLLLSGSLGDRYGIRRTFLWGIACFGISSIACGLAPNASILIALRALQGVSAALMIPGSLAMIARVTPGHSLGRAIGLWSAFTLMATALGPVIGGILVQNNLWRGVFFINLPLSVIAGIITLKRSPADPTLPTQSHPIDWPGASLLIIGLASLSYALIDRSLLFAFGTLTFLLFYLREKSTSHPLLPLALLRSRPLLAALLISLVIYAAWAGFTYLLPSYLIETLRFSPTNAGLLQIPTLFVLAIVSPIAGKLLDRYGPRPTLALGSFLCALGFAALLWPGFIDFPYAIIAPLLILGLGLGFCAAPLSATIVSNVPAEHHGLAAGLNSTAARIASALGVALLGSLAYQEQVLHFSTLAASAVILCLIAIPATLVFPTKKTSTTLEEP
jgi:EmrB/QacA subfamily drug resistance transporter